MSEKWAEGEFQRFWKRLQQLGLNAYESRSYLVLLGHPRFKALELAARAHVPRQKIYEVLDSLVEKGFAQVVQERTKLFSAVEPSLALPAYMARKRQILEQELTDHGRASVALDRRPEIGLFGRARAAAARWISCASSAIRRKPPPNIAACCRKCARNTWSFPVRPMPSIRWMRRLVKQARAFRRRLPAAAGSRHAGRRAPADTAGVRGRRRRGAARRIRCR